MKSETLDVSTKIRLLITMINDEGRIKLLTEMEKLTTRLTDYYQTNKVSIKQTLTKAITLIPLKGGIYALLLNKLAIPELTNDVYFLIIQYLKENENPFIVFRLLLFLFQSINEDLIAVTSLNNFIQQIFDHNNINMIQIIKYSFAYLIENNDQCKTKLIPAIDLFNSLNQGNKDNIWRIIYEEYTNSKDNKVFGLDLSELRDSNHTNGSKKDNSININPFEELLSLPMINLDICQLPFNHFSQQESVSIEVIQQTMMIIDILTGMKDNIDRCANYLMKIFSFYNIEVNEQQKSAYYQYISESILNVIFSPLCLKRDITLYGALVNELIHRSSSFESQFMNTISIFPKIIENLSPLSISNYVYFISFFINNNLAESNHILSIKYDITNDNRAYYYTKMFCEKLSSLLTKEKVTSLVQDFSKQYDSFLAEINDQPKVLINQAQNAIYAEMSENFKVKRSYDDWKDKLPLNNIHENELLHVFTTCLLCTRSKTLSHLREAIYFYKETIRSIASNEEKEFILLKGLFDTWEHSSIHLIFIIELLFNNHILSHITAIKYIFSEKLNQSKDNVLNWQFYELIETTISNCEILLGKTKNELNEQQQSLAKSDEDSRQEIIQKIELFEGIEGKLKIENEKIAKETLLKYYQLCDVCEKLGGKNLQEFILGNIDNFILMHYNSIGNYTQEKERVDKLKLTFK